MVGIGWLVVSTVDILFDKSTLLNTSVIFVCSDSSFYEQKIKLLLVKN